MAQPRPMLMIEARHNAVYYFPMEDVRQDLLVASDKRTKSQTNARHATGASRSAGTWPRTGPGAMRTPRRKVVVGGEVVAETTRPRLLFETALPTRHMPNLDARLELLVPSDTVTACPYKKERLSTGQ